jgi:phosphosulfolactate phosphohydrolase-like enzyme
VVMQSDVELRARDTWKAVGRGDLIIVIDALRSGTSILNALTNGAEAVIPTMTLKEAYELHSQHPEYLLAGEREKDRNLRVLTLEILLWNLRLRGLKEKAW